jgi:hypothetical protein
MSVGEGESESAEHGAQGKEEDKRKELRTKNEKHETRNE